MTWNFSPHILLQGIDQLGAQNYLQSFEGNKKCVVAGVADKYTNSQYDDIPIFDLVKDAIAHQGNISTSLIFSHPYQVLDAGLEAIKGGIQQLVIPTEKIPPFDLLKLYEKARSQGVKILGASQGGILIPEKFYAGVVNAHIFSLGNIAILNYGDGAIASELAYHWKKSNLGVSAVINLGNNPLSLIDWELWLKLLAEDNTTETIVISLSNISLTETEKLAEALSHITHKTIIIYLLDINYLKSKMNSGKAKVISDQIFSHLYPLATPELIKEYLSFSHTLVTEKYQAIAHTIIDKSSKNS